MAFVDDYSTWITGPSAEANREGIQVIVDKEMERRGRAEQSHVLRGQDSDNSFH